jgi:hypothetical protein
VLVVASKAVSSTNWAILSTAVSTMGSFRFRAQSRAHDSKRATDMASVHDLSLGILWCRSASVQGASLSPLQVSRKRHPSVRVPLFPLPRDHRTIRPSKGPAWLTLTDRVGVELFSIEITPSTEYTYCTVGFRSKSNQGPVRTYCIDRACFTMGCHTFRRACCFKQEALSSVVRLLLGLWIINYIHLSLWITDNC